ncbi:hypothetical protein [Elizabethkingia anophelis]|uniref:Zinc ribbon domain-containing protein n=1 Tax=Elizabethkingia anophelis R26 TaxID=1246994 RepID=A0ABM6MR58_9FLAO|nr:hypothetical protein [Elizabethkingia anophelis]ATC35571.1 hypothetical protein BAZ09_004800 [Elizabethkingia anophelis R26]ATC39209.1 hypothetical protein EAAG1_004800 [Elizabethkingia anophelis Ag1]ATC42890.1 hypothetical protein CMV41_04800 [Elizabethkingia anophelis]ATC46566.1 hypothetical protein CMV40_04800 [Elizabethkingia anophelis]ELR78606.1 hypothetical protein D505_12385 [Elizabethkingia anophelis R26]
MTDIINKIKRLKCEFNALLIVAVFTVMISLVGLYYYDIVQKKIFYSAIWIFSIAGSTISFSGCVVKFLEVQEFKRSLKSFVNNNPEFSHMWKPLKFNFFKGLTVLGKPISGKQISLIKLKKSCDFCGINPKEMDSNYCKACKHKNLS